MKFKPHNCTSCHKSTHETVSCWSIFNGQCGQLINSSMQTSKPMALSKYSNYLLVFHARMHYPLIVAPFWEQWIHLLNYIDVEIRDRMHLCIWFSTRPAELCDQQHIFRIHTSKCISHIYVLAYDFSTCANK